MTIKPLTHVQNVFKKFIKPALVSTGAAASVSLHQTGVSSAGAELNKVNPYIKPNSASQVQVKPEINNFTPAQYANPENVDIAKRPSWGDVEHSVCAPKGMKPFKYTDKIFCSYYEGVSRSAFKSGIFRAQEAVAITNAEGKKLGSEILGRGIGKKECKQAGGQYIRGIHPHGFEFDNSPYSASNKIKDKVMFDARVKICRGWPADGKPTYPKYQKPN